MIDDVEEFKPVCSYVPISLAILLIYAQESHASFPISEPASSLFSPTSSASSVSDADPVVSVSSPVLMDIPGFPCVNLEQHEKAFDMTKYFCPSYVRTQSQRLKHYLNFIKESLSVYALDADMTVRVSLHDPIGIC